MANNTATASGMPFDRIGDLIGRVAAGDMAAYDELYRLMCVPATAVARRILGDSQLAEDAVQEAALRVLHRAGTFTPGNGRGWYLTVVRNVALSMATSRGRSDIISPDHAVDTSDRRQRAMNADGIHVSAVEAGFLDRMMRQPWFCRLIRRDQRIVVLLCLGYSNVDVIAMLPEVTHNETIRRAVGRARDSWREYPPRDI